MKLSSSTQKTLLTINPGAYFKVQANEMKLIEKSTTGLVVGSFESPSTGDATYDVALVQGELLLVPSQAGETKNDSEN